MNEYAIQMSAAESSSFLLGLYNWGIEVIKVIQRIESPELTVVMKFITALGSTYFYLPIILLIFWCIDEKKGLQLGILIIVSAWINSYIKDLLKHPRPFHMEPFLGLTFEPTYGAPSGHAQMSLTFWPPVAIWFSIFLTKKKPALMKPSFKWTIWASLILFILLMGFTRLYLGVHFPTDLFLGWLIAGILVALWFIPGPFLMEKLSSAGIRAQNISAAAIALLMNGLYPEDRTLPALLLGFCVGYTLMKQRFPFSSREKINGKAPGIPVLVFRCLIGFAGMAVIYLALKLALPGEGSLFGNIFLWGEFSPFYELGRFIRYGLVGLWVSAGAPYVFQRMRLAANAGAFGKEP